jgi:glycosyltransferase involved in cell wall biosynthesis
VLKAGEYASGKFPNETVVVSRTLQKHYNSRYSLNCTYIPNGTELRLPTGSMCLEQFGLSPNQYVLFLGRFSPEKNCHLLIDAFERTQTAVKLVLAGGSSHTDAYVSRIRRHASDQIKILDWLSGNALDQVLTNAALFVLPSDMEGLSLSLLEAMGAGLCVLASDTPENREVIEDCGFTFKAGDTDDLQCMLALLMNDAELRERAGERARTRVRENYLWDKVTREIEAVYRDLLAAANSRVRETDNCLEKSA